jgi:CHAT domain-containing protein
MMRAEDHIGLSDLELLTMDGQSLSRDLENRVIDVRKHLHECQECAAAAEWHAMLMRNRSDGPTHLVSSCPPTEILFRLAAGLLPEAEATALQEHATSCGACGQELRLAFEDVGSPDSDAEMLKLESSSTEWQARLAHQLAAENVSGELIKSLKGGKVVAFPLRSLWMTGIAAMLLAVVALVGWRVYRGESDDALLASAYNLERRTSQRLPGGDAVPLASPTRGNQEALTQVDLLKLKLRAEEHLNKNPNDAYWQQVLGRIALAEGDGDTASAKFEIAHSLKPALQGLEFDRAAAYFERGEAHDQSQYAKSAQLYGQVLHDPSERGLWPLAYFNLALSWERQEIYCEAVTNYRSALQLEKNPSWHREIQDRIEKTTPLCEKSKGSGYLRLDKSPAAFLGVTRSNPEQAEADYESYLEEASREWLTARTSKPEAEAALRQLAAIGLNHHDAWLRDLLQSPQSALAHEATVQLAKGLQASTIGDADIALAALTNTASLYQKVGNPAGVLRARVERVYVLQRMGRSDDCLNAAAPLAQDRQLQRDSWLNSYLILETAICRAARGDWMTYAHEIRRSLELSRASGLPLQVLREEGLLVESLDHLGQTNAAWVVADSGLEDCIRRDCPPMRIYQFLQSLRGVMQAKGLESATANLADAASLASTSVSNVQIRAYAQEVLGTAETNAGNMQAAAEAFGKASALLKSMPPGQAVNLYSADWEADRSLLMEREGQRSVALQRLEQVEPEIAATDNYLVRQRHYTQLASLLLHANQPAQALARVLVAIKDAEYSLSATSNETERLSWERINRRGYLLLVQSLVAMDKPREALQAWEWYRSAPYRTAVESSSFHYTARGLPPFPDLPVSQGRNLTLVIARLEDFFVAWSIKNSSDGSIRMIRIAAEPKRVVDMANTFTELCSNRDSSEADIRVLGYQLYDDLLSPFDDQTRQTSLLLLDLDGSLQRLPFAAVSNAAHQYLNDTHALIFLPGWWTLQPLPPDTVSSNPNVLVVEGAASMPRFGLSGATASLPAEYLESNDIGTKFSHVTLIKPPQSNSDTLRKLLPQAEIFHFTGHTLNREEETGLLLRYPDSLFTASSLNGISLRRCRLAVLATCSSAGPSPYGMDDTSNLTHALLIAGASNVVATLWDVDSRASRLMMLRFYESITQSVSVSDAVRRAQQTLRSDSSTSHPFYWSSMQVFSG